ncbi:MAG: alginate lyase family protein [Betaproteobacteria bacterium]|nr:alginate lyase family protein [Betaproteobacteria bacterium]
MVSATRFRFLNEEHGLEGAIDWNAPGRARLWLYNLHYFDDLNAADAECRAAAHARLIARWIAENPPGKGVGWEPYPLSLRIVNWVKWAACGHTLPPGSAHSLAQQARHLTQRLEYHLLGNHLFANAKALVFAGAFFAGPEADRWMRQGMEILVREVPEQILPDGGHFERSPMYHAIALEDMLDLVNLACACPGAFAGWAQEIAVWRNTAAGMLRWLLLMCHPDGEVSFFNDAAMGIAPPPGELIRYARRLDVPVAVPNDGVSWLNASGYVRVQKHGAVLIADVAPVGPDYLPGHAHADVLSFELSVNGRRLLVNSGTSCYAGGAQREWERSTAAHNTVELDGQSSSEVWASFRVARRAYPFDVEVAQSPDRIVIEGAHDGYRRLKGRPIHRRRWVLQSQRLEIDDRIEGRAQCAISRLYLHPETSVFQRPGGGYVQTTGAMARWEALGGEVSVRAAHWHPEFGLSLPSTRIETHMRGEQALFRLDWCE